MRMLEINYSKEFSMNNLYTENKQIKDPIYGFVDFEGRETQLLSILSDPFYQRLRRVKQLGFSDHIFPSATHTRFSHSLGVFHVAKKMLALVEPHVVNGNWSNEGLACLAAALLHDVGHGMFSHVFEGAVKKHLEKKYRSETNKIEKDPLFLSVNHEKISQRIIKSGSISNILNKIYPGMSNDVSDMLDDKGNRSKSIYKSIISSQLDADRLDYVQRDPYFAGVSSGGIDLEWILRNLTVEKEKDDNLYFSIESKAYASIEQYLVTLFQLYPTIYLHKKTRSLQYMFGLIISKVFRYIDAKDLDSVGLSDTHPFVVLINNPDDIDNLLRLDDSLFWYSIGLFSVSTDDHLKKLIDMIYRRDLFKVIDVWKIVDSVVPERADESASDHFKSVQNICQKICDKLITDERFISEKCFYDSSKRILYKGESAITPKTQKINIKMGDRCSDISLVSPIVASGAEYHVHRIYVDHSVYSEWQGMEAEIKALAREIEQTQ
ncbi:HD domain-containing protein [Acetobacter thailandicus]|uniref:HD domain-containing protein n=1 Tax=Acetobacter thailandicus TaxID=1502842 RepID=UPI001BA53A44|nr:HD domain-containing protein [Acetobacter thailandicus]MBS0961219.1 HD domain-containing protein [Acetobacter thailandicus]